ncbi:hypothetical protein RBH94_12375 [Aestuariibaculum sp. YM273]|uniref:hypothetical protein n=1 Tax=Aestuariibaculum sp. YM273 TaxID=3070659 RepID=UPI0027DD0E2E|nr:hypothetical protein [Aestuariibaculum sp. YM273]WMI64852.1 hypothetical protein RBH94_12375 [Aestuariibaculum sp. YM273]
MKTNYLLPHKYKKIGWVLFLSGILFWLSKIIFDYDTIFFETNVLSIFNSGKEFNGNTVPFFRLEKNDISDEIMSFLIIIGGLLIGFSKEKIEDEFIHKLRHESLVWAIIFNYIVLLLTIVFLYDMNFLNVMIYNMFTPLLFFIIRFNFLKYKSNSHEE